MPDTETDPRRVPLPAAILGGAGVLPFAALAATVWLAPTLRELALAGIASYGAVILSFMGGCRWGFAAAGLGPGPGWSALTLSVLPALYAWPLLFAADPQRTALLAVGFLGLYAADVSLTRRGGAPAWWPRLRLPLTAGAAGSLLVAAAGAGG